MKLIKRLLNVPQIPIDKPKMFVVHEIDKQFDGTTRLLSWLVGENSLESFISNAEKEGRQFLRHSDGTLAVGILN